MTLFSLKWGQDLENWAAYPTKNSQAYPGGFQMQFCRLRVMGAKSKPNAKEMPTAFDKTPKKSLGQKLPPKNIPSRISKP